MLLSLAIRDIVLIERLDLDFRPGLAALTGETGAGKSIVLDSLGLSLGARADRGLIRAGAQQGSVTAVFEVADSHKAMAILDEQGLPRDEELVLRRLITQDGRSRAYLNGEPVSTTILRRVGEALVEVHGQADQKGLADPKAQQTILDALGGHEGVLSSVSAGYRRWKDLADRLEEQRDAVKRARLEEDYLRHRLAELEELAPEAGEEERLAELRQRLMSREKVLETLNDAQDSLAGSGGAVERLSAAQRRLERGVDASAAGLEPALAALERALIEAQEAEAQLDDLQRALAEEEADLDKVEERLFALRDAARKHRVPVEGLPTLAEATAADIAKIDAGSDMLENLEREVEAARLAYLERARELSALRREAATRLSQTVQAELAPLKLDRATLRVKLQPLGEDAGTSTGLERVAFEIRTNPGQPFGPLSKVASGGELSRLMLALKVVLARVESAGTMIFDEVDAGIGGATADAVGERLLRLAAERQILVVTHAPQVAARAHDHLTVSKLVEGEATSVEVRRLVADERRDEVARMLAGAEVTEAARAAAASLIAAGGA